MLARPLLLDNGIARPLSDGDIMDAREIEVALTTVGAGSILAVHLGAAVLRRSGPVGGFTDTFDTAQNIVNAFAGNANAVPSGVTFGGLYIPANIPQPGANYRWLYINTVAQAMVAAVTVNGGVILSTAAGVVNTIAASLWREYRISLVNTTQQSIVQGTFSNVSAVVTGLSTAQTNLITPGQVVASVGNVTAGTTVISVQPGVGFTMSANGLAVATASATLMPQVVVAGLRSGTA